MDTILDEPVFTVADRAYRWEEVVAAARSWGDWQRLERSARDGAELARRAAARGLPRPGELETAANEFRYARNLLSADETEQWLARWELEPDDWVDYLRRTLLREQRAGSVKPVEPALDAEALATATWAEAVCSGELERLTRRLAERAAVYLSMEGRPPGLDRLTEMDAAFERFLAAAAGDEAVRRERAAHALDWTRLDCVTVVAPNEPVAREAALCVREDRRELAEVAREAGLTPSERSVYLDQADPELVPRLLSAHAGDLVGPVARDGEFLLLFVRARTAPSLEDPEVRARAERRARELAIENEVLRHVRWHDPAQPARRRQKSS